MAAGPCGVETPQKKGGDGASLRGAVAGARPVAGLRGGMEDYRGGDCSIPIPPSNGASQRQSNGRGAADHPMEIGGAVRKKCLFYFK